MFHFVSVEIVTTLPQVCLADSQSTVVWVSLRTLPWLRIFTFCLDFRKYSFTSAWQIRVRVSTSWLVLHLGFGFPGSEDTCKRKEAIGGVKQSGAFKRRFASLVSGLTLSYYVPLINKWLPVAQRICSTEIWCMNSSRLGSGTYFLSFRSFSPGNEFLPAVRKGIIFFFLFYLQLPEHNLTSANSVLGSDACSLKKCSSFIHTAVNSSSI